MSKEKEYLFKYYEDQYSQWRHRSTMRSNLTLQILVMAGAAVAGYARLPDGQELVKGLLGVFIIIVGLIGFLACRAHEKSNNIHEDRARLARAYFDKVENIARKEDLNQKKFPPIAIYYLMLHVLVSIIGLLLLLSSLKVIPCT